MTQENRTLWCPTGCDELPASGVCRVCGYHGEGVPEEETLNYVHHEDGRWMLRPRLPRLYFDDERLVEEELRDFNEPS